jgi:thioredoxin-like negative regulator of GroEL
MGVAAEYVLEGPTISTYLRDRRDEARAFDLALRASAGDASRVLDELGALVAAKPFNYAHRAQLADALAGAGRADSAIATLEHSQRVLRAAGQPRADYAIRIAALQLGAGRPVEARAAIDFVLQGDPLPNDPRLVGVLAGLGETDRAESALNALPKPWTPAERAGQARARAAFLRARDDAVGAEHALRSAVAETPSDVAARLVLIDLLVAAGRADEAIALADNWPRGPLPSGADYRRRAGERIRRR